MGVAAEELDIIYEELGNGGIKNWRRVRVREKERLMRGNGEDPIP